MKKPLAVCCSDIHLTHLAPKMWNHEVWLSAQCYMLQQINQIAEQYHAPVLCAGDIFDRSKMPPEIEIIAMNNMATWNLTSGQHDQPYHDMKQLPFSSYGVLEAHNTPKPVEMDIYKFPWGAEFIPLDEQEKERKHPLTCAMVHAMVWKGKEPYPGAPKKGNVENLVKWLSGYDFIVAGDNHGGFVTTIGDTTIVNCGSTMRRTTAQINYQPCVHVLFDDKTVESIPLDISKDVVSDEHKVERQEKEDRIGAFVDTLQKEQDISLSFRTNINRFFEKNEVEQKVQRILLEEMK